MYQQSFLNRDSFLNQAFLNRDSTVYLDKIQIYQSNNDIIDGQAFWTTSWLADDPTAVLAVFDIKGFLFVSLGLELVKWTGLSQFYL
jgi:hypothetical protein